eukprot:CAMPEP_0197053766 /NCGR_PEP_ID=MMETSP1384-20130603/27933_1 /TAXON_ID=29189 /ORGANISM="Ammonia sp." /LENGTH=197 /DNA_ID=CAMNT_0042486707 /DNA_START=103 /DNA_END=697 /DNA_ORIENTATION=-
MDLLHGSHLAPAVLLIQFSGTAHRSLIHSDGHQRHKEHEMGLILRMAGIAARRHDPKHVDGLQLVRYCDDFGMFCEEESKGKIWMAMTCTSVVLGLFAWCGILRELKKDSKAITIIALALYAIICIANVLIYVLKPHRNGVSICGEYACRFLNEGTNEAGGIYECSSTWGLSLIFVMIAGCFAILSAIFTAIITYDD